MTLRLNIRHLKSFAWLAVVLALGGAGMTFWDIFQGQQQNEFDARGTDEFRAIRDSRLEDARDLSNTQTSYHKQYQETMWLARTDGSRYVPPKPKDPEAENAKPEDIGIVVPPLDTLVDISMVAWSSTPALSFVALRYTDAAAPISSPVKAKRLHLGEGDVLRPPYDEEPYSGKVLSIESQKVVFAWGGEEVELTPQLGTDGKGRTLVEFNIDDRVDPLSELDGPPEESVQLKDGSWVVGQKEREQFRDLGPALLEDIGVRTITPEKGRSVMELADIPADSPIRTYGFESGDRIISVNGIPMSSKSAAWNWYDKNDSLSSYDIKYESRGQVKTKTIHNPNVD